MAVTLRVATSDQARVDPGFLYDITIERSTIFHGKFNGHLVVYDYPIMAISWYLIPSGKLLRSELERSSMLSLGKSTISTGKSSFNIIAQTFTKKDRVYMVVSGFFEPSFGGFRERHGTPKSYEII